MFKKPNGSFAGSEFLKMLKSAKEDGRITNSQVNANMEDWTMENIMNDYVNTFHASLDAYDPSSLIIL
jgi:hypothetical protein